MANRDAGVLGIFVRDLHQFLAAILVQFRNAQANDLALGRRRQAEIGIDDRLLHRMHQRFVPDLDADQARLRHADGRDLNQRHVAP